ncbi:hypothetical protein Trydic_g14469 [Trypoxylus dichotomus]
MNFPNNISKNTVKVYHVPDIEFKQTKRVISINLFQWHANIPKTLKEWSIQAICDNWAEKPLVNELPVLPDIMSLLDILPTTLPLNLTAGHIAYDCYWLRCYRDRWPKKPPIGRNFSEIESLQQEKKQVLTYSSSLSSDNSEIGDRSSKTGSSEKLSKVSSQYSKESSPSSPLSRNTAQNEETLKTWKEFYFEMHIKEYLENLEPENYDGEKIKEITSLCKDYVTSLTLNEMRAPTKTDVPDHIPLISILGELHRLTELTLCFKQTYIGEKFSWHIFNTTMTDIKILAKGLEHTKLQILRIQNSDINCAKVKMLLKALSKNVRLRELDFSHCKIADHGTMVIAKYADDHENLKHLILTNNFIGPNGVKSLAYALSLNCKLVSLNLRLNMIRSKGGQYIIRSLIHGGKHLQSLVMAGCGLTESNLEIEKMLRYNISLKEMDLSNNRFGKDMGRVILEGLKHNKTLTHLDIRRCNFNPDTEWEILKAIKENRSRGFVETPDSYRKTEEDPTQEIFTQEFVDEFNTVFNE